jgi:hypothetical protein
MNAIREVRNAWRYLREQPAVAALPRWRQLLEMLVLYGCRGIGPGYYMQARWWRPELSFRHKWQHMNRREYNHFIDRLNLLEYQKASQHKLVEKAVLQLQGIPTAPFVGFAHNQRGRSASGAPLCNAGQLTALLQTLSGVRLCCKQVEGWGGFGFAAFEVVVQGQTVQLISPVSQQALSPAQWWQQFGNQTDGILLERYLVQHADLAALNASSVNTIRMWVYEKDGEFHVPGAYLRVGRAGSQVDNNSSGGLCCPVNVETGRTLASMDIKRSCYPHPQHPDSGATLVDIPIPHWQDCKVLAGQALAAFPHMRVAGLDMAVTPDGPCLIELNVRPDYIGCAWMDMPLHELAKQI